MTVPQTYRTGANSPKKRIPILEIPGLATYKLRQNDPEPFNDPNVINLEWVWDQENASGHWRKFVPKILGPETYYVQYTWNAEQGLFDGYIDGNPLRIPGEPMEPWSLSTSKKEIILPERDGNFMQYNRGLHAYHISYYANTPGNPGRVSSNMRKDGEFYLMDQGPVAILPGSQKVHHMRLIKDGGHIQLQVDGKVRLDFTDSGGERFGPRYHGGKVGFRQMQWTEGWYRNFRAWELETPN